MRTINALSCKSVYDISLSIKAPIGYQIFIVFAIFFASLFSNDLLAQCNVSAPADQTICRGQGESDYGDFNKYPITANHYLGSWDRYNARNDARRSREVSHFVVLDSWQLFVCTFCSSRRFDCFSQLYDVKAKVKHGQDQWVEGWLNGFIKTVGNDRAVRLLGQRYLKTSEKRPEA